MARTTTKFTPEQRERALANGIPKMTFLQRIYRGWDAERAINEPLQTQYSSTHQYLDTVSYRTKEKKWRD